MDPIKEKNFLALLSEHRFTIAKLCAHYAKDAESQKDLEQEVILNIWKSYGSFRKEAKLSTWIYRIILNVCLKHTYAIEKHVVSLEDLHETITDDDENASSLLQDLSACIQALEFADKSIIILHLEELPYSSIGDLMGITENHVAVKIKRIRGKIAKCLTKIQAI